MFILDVQALNQPSHGGVKYLGILSLMNLSLKRKQPPEELRRHEPEHQTGRGSPGKGCPDNEDNSESGSLALEAQ